MKKLSLGLLLVLVLVVAASAFSVQAAPPMPTPTPIPFVRPSFTDGRINAYDPGAPVAVFETRKTVPIVNDNGVPTSAVVVNSVQLLFWDGAKAKEVMNVSADTINSAIDKFMGKQSTTVTSPSTNTTGSTATTSNNNSTSSANATSSSTSNSNANASANTTKLTTVNNGNSVVISKENGYSLYYSKDGYLWITTPANFEGKVYTFSWQKDF